MVFVSPPGPAALLSCLGFPGWGSVHLIVPRRADPPGLAGRLEQASGDEAAGGLLLPALLRCHRDLEPLAPGRFPWAGPVPQAWPDGWPRAWGHRYLLVCRSGAADGLRISAWERQQVPGGWVRACGPLSLTSFLGRFR